MRNLILKGFPFHSPHHIICSLSDSHAVLLQPYHLSCRQLINPGSHFSLDPYHTECFIPQSCVFLGLSKGFSAIDGMEVITRVKWNYSLIFSIFMSGGLKHTWPHVITASKPRRIHLLPGTTTIVTVKPSIKVLMKIRIVVGQQS